MCLPTPLPTIHPSIRPSIHPFFRPSAVRFLSACLTVHLYVCLFVCPSICPSAYLSVYPSVLPSTAIYILQSIHQYILPSQSACLSICIHAAGSIYRTNIHSGNSLSFTKDLESLPCSQDPATGPYPKPDESCLYSLIPVSLISV